MIENCLGSREVIVMNITIRSASVIITNIAETKFVLQRKDATHPNPACRGLLGLFGGQIEKGERPIETLFRELREEIAQSAIGRTVGKFAEHLENLRLLGMQFPGCYELTVFVSRLSDEDFGPVAQAMLKSGGVLEGTAELFERAVLEERLRQTNLFFASQNVPVQYFLNKKRSF